MGRIPFMIQTHFTARNEMTNTPTFDALKELRKPFPANQISKLPKETKYQIDERKADKSTAFVCPECGGWHHKKAVHLDYVGHAALTDRLLDADPMWNWEPLSFGPDGLPVLDRIGGMWIKLTVAGMTRLGYGHAEGKTGGDAIKEVIGDALRNAAMRFGAALDLWHKGDLHGDDDDGNEPAKPAQKPVQPKQEKPKAETPFDSLQGIAGDQDAIVDEMSERTRLCRTLSDLEALKAAPEFKLQYKTLDDVHKNMVKQSFAARAQGIERGN